MHSFFTLSFFETNKILFNSDGQYIFNTITIIDTVSISLNNKTCIDTYSHAHLLLIIIKFFWTNLAVCIAGCSGVRGSIVCNINQLQAVAIMNSTLDRINLAWNTEYFRNCINDVLIWSKLY